MDDHWEEIQWVCNNKRWDDRCQERQVVNHKAVYEVQQGALWMMLSNSREMSKTSSRGLWSSQWSKNSIDRSWKWRSDTKI